LTIYEPCLLSSTDESYNLFIPPPLSDDSDHWLQGSGLIAKLWAKTQIGALRGLETFSQLVTFEWAQREYVIGNVPWMIIDSPVRS
jgi:hexosaminidase